MELGLIYAPAYVRNQYRHVSCQPIAHDLMLWATFVISIEHAIVDNQCLEWKQQQHPCDCHSMSSKSTMKNKCNLTRGAQVYKLSLTQEDGPKNCSSDQKAYVKGILCQVNKRGPFTKLSTVLLLQEWALTFCTYFHWSQFIKSKQKIDCELYELYMKKT